MADTVGERIQRIMDEKEIKREELQFSTKVNWRRLSEIIDAGISPSDREEEYTRIATALDVHEIELRDDYAQECGRFLRAMNDYECFPKMFPTVASLPQREKENLDPQDERFQLLLEETLDAHWNEGLHLWNRDEEFPYWSG